MTLYEAVLDINQSVQNHSDTIDQVEKKLVDVNKMRKQKREQNNQKKIQKEMMPYQS